MNLRSQFHIPRYSPLGTVSICRSTSEVEQSDQLMHLRPHADGLPRQWETSQTLSFLVTSPLGVKSTTMVVVILGCVRWNQLGTPLLPKVSLEMIWCLLQPMNVSEPQHMLLLKRIPWAQKWLLTWCHRRRTIQSCTQTTSWVCTLLQVQRLPLLNVSAQSGKLGLK